jgi:hypothetical protein
LSPFQRAKTFIANLKTATRGTYHHVRFAKYRNPYLAEAQYRVNRRFDLHFLVGRLVRAAAHTQPCSEKWLRPAVGAV